MNIRSVHRSALFWNIEVKIAKAIEEIKAKAAASRKRMPPLPHDWQQREKAEAQRKAARIERISQPSVTPTVHPEIEKKLIADSVAKHRAQCADPTCRCRPAPGGKDHQ
jgi:hypothetical protein